MDTLKADWQCKLIIIGDSGVGKTCVMRRFTDNEFSYNFVATIGIDFKLRMVKVRDKVIKVQIWDTAGQEKFRSITTAYYRGAKGVLIVYDITSELSFQNVVKWVRNFRRVAQQKLALKVGRELKKWAGDDIESMLIGNKNDREEAREVTKHVAEKVAKENGMLFAETSAKDGVNVDAAFNEILTIIVDKHLKRLAEQTDEMDGRSVTLSSKAGSEDGKTFPCCAK